MNACGLKLMTIIILVMLVFLWMSSVGAFADEVAPIYGWIRATF